MGARNDPLEYPRCNCFLSEVVSFLWALGDKACTRQGARNNLQRFVELATLLEGKQDEDTSVHTYFVQATLMQYIPMIIP